MRFVGEAGGTRRTVRVRREDGGWAVAVDDRVVYVSVAADGGCWSLLIGPPAAAKSYEILFERRRPGDLTVYVNGRAVPVAVRPDTLVRRGGPASPAAAGGRAAVVAPMPGRIVKVLVAPGEAVRAHEGVVVVEAMKMENELRAPRAGIVREVRVAEGGSVEAGAILIVIE